VVRITKDLDTGIEGRHVLVVEDVIDSGRTLRYLMRNLASREPASLEVCALLAKPAADRLDLRTRYVGFRLPDVFVVGYGLDVDECHRELPYIATLGDATGA
jgi:hypoxanthine phosphoribosyltransferase